MNQQPANLVEAAAMNRRKYLWNKIVLRSNVIGTSFWMLVGVFGTAVCGVLTCITLFWAFTVPKQVPFTAPVILAPFTVFMAFQTRRFYRYLQQSRQDEEALLYVAPVRDQVIAALPADEVLLRGSDQPVAKPDALVRAAHEVKETSSEELLLPTTVDTKHECAAQRTCERPDKNAARIPVAQGAFECIFVCFGMCRCGFCTGVTVNDFLPPGWFHTADACVLGLVHNRPNVRICRMAVYSVRR